MIARLGQLIAILLISTLVVLGFSIKAEEDPNDIFAKTAAYSGLQAQMLYALIARESVAQLVDLDFYGLMVVRDTTMSCGFVNRAPMGPTSVYGSYFCWIGSVPNFGCNTFGCNH